METYETLKKRNEKQMKIALEILEIFKSNHLSYLEIEETLRKTENMVKNHAYLER